MTFSPYLGLDIEGQIIILLNLLWIRANCEYK